MLDMCLIKLLCQKGSVYWTRHVFRKMNTRGIKAADIVLALESGEIIEQYVDENTYPACLILSFLPNGEPVHLACSLRYDTLNLVTVYHPNTEKWLSDYKTRRI